VNQRAAAAAAAAAAAKNGVGAWRDSHVTRQRQRRLNHARHATAGANNAAVSSSSIRRSQSSTREPADVGGAQINQSIVYFWSGPSNKIG